MIKATIPPENPDAAMGDYTLTCRTFSWKKMEEELSRQESGDINIAHEAIDRWAARRDTRDRTALIFERADKVSKYSYVELRDMSCRWANLLIEHGFAAGDRLFIFLPPCPEIYFVMPACARLGIIFSPIYSTLGFDELEVRLQNAKPKGIVTHPDLVERLPAHCMSSVECTFLTEGPKLNVLPGEIPVKGVLDEFPKKSPVRWLRGATPLFLIYTSGSTGPPKGVVHAHQDMLGHLMTAKYVLNISDHSVLWTDGDPGWITGTVYGAFAPWLCGATTVIQGDGFSASTWYRTLERHQVTVWYTTPRTITRLMEAGDDLPGRYDFSSLRHVATVGETLSPEQFYWAKKTLKHSPHDTWWMTETGMICLANFASMNIKPGSMGRPVPGMEAAVLDEHGNPVPPMTMGELALRPGWPSMMTGIWNDAARYQAYFRFRDWFLTGDMVTEDEDGYFYHQGRNDDLIKVGEKFVGPYEIEQILSLHPAVAEAVVISLGSVPGKVRVKGYVTIAEGFNPSARLNHEIRAFVKAHFSPEIPLKEIEFLEEIPKTRSGKLLRRVLRAREHGLPSGDPSRLKE
ncbi:MAG: AMP-binding protein [Desulfomonilaceae bacterium]|nr:AMP-binding protein [Desulfomonilaceae bacterium]